MEKPPDHKYLFQIELCSHHLVLNSSSCRGYLHKMGSSSSSSSGKPTKSAFARATWNKRWFVFDRNKRTVLYFADKQEAKVKGGIYFQVGQQTKIQGDPSPLDLGLGDPSS